MKALLKAPKSVQFLVLMYVFSLGADLYLIRNPTLIDEMGWVPFVVSVLISANFLILIYFRVSWTWIAGLLTCLYGLFPAISGLISGNEMTSKAIQMTKEAREMSQIPPDQMAPTSDLAYYGIMILFVASSIFFSVLWYLSRGYFKKKVVE